MTTTQQSSTKWDILQHLLKQGEATALDLAESLQISPQAVRRHLKDLETEGLIVQQGLKAGSGRPNHIYALSAAGRNQFPDRYDDFAVSLLDTLAETVGKDQMKSILQKQWERKALEYCDRLGKGPLKERVERLVNLRRAEGYMAEFHSIDLNTADLDPSNSDVLDNSALAQLHAGAKVHDKAHDKAKGGTDPSEMAAEIQPPRECFILTEYNCAISHIAESYPSVCGHELEMFAVALPDCTVQRTHWLVNGEHRCGYLIQPKE